MNKISEFFIAIGMIGLYIFGIMMTIIIVYILLRGIL